MQHFRYRALEAPGRVHEGVLQADSADAVVRTLNARGWFAVDLRPQPRSTRGGWFELHRRTRVLPVADQAVLARQLADLLAAGVLALEALQVVESHSDRRRIRQAVAGLSEKVRGGVSLSQALAEQDGVFPSTVLAVLEAGEAAGALDQVLGTIASLLEQQAELMQRIRQALTYPALVCAASVLTLGVLFGFLLPRLGQLYGGMGQQLPLPTRVLLAVANATAAWWPAVVALLAVALLAGANYLRRAPERRVQLEQRLFAVPGLGSLLLLWQLVPLAKTLATLLNGGISPVAALRLAEGVSSSLHVKRQTAAVAEAVHRGEPLAGAFASARLFSGPVETILHVGERSGEFAQALARAGEYLDRQLRANLQRLTSLLEPALIIGLAVIVGGIVLAMILPILELDLTIR